MTRRLLLAGLLVVSFLAIGSGGKPELRELYFAGSCVPGWSQVAEYLDPSSGATISLPGLPTLEPGACLLVPEAIWKGYRACCEAPGQAGLCSPTATLELPAPAPVSCSSRFYLDGSQAP